MKKLLYKLFILTFSTTLFTSNVFASNNANINNLKKYDNRTIEENNKFIKIEDGKGITIIYKELLNDNYYNVSNEINIKSLGKKYIIKNPTYVGEYINFNNDLDTVSGNSGVNISLSKSYSIGASYNSSISVSASDISSSVGFNVSKNYTVSYGGSYTVPSNVKRATLTAYPLYDKYKYDIYLKGSHNMPDVKLDSGYALKPIGVHYEKELIYK